MITIYIRMVETTTKSNGSKILCKENGGGTNFSLLLMGFLYIYIYIHRFTPHPKTLFFSAALRELQKPIPGKGFRDLQIGISDPKGPNPSLK